ncbi:protein dispatched homolog 1-like isoform X2 [Ptychodera flava]|uniref:protein dispatched homolog 1-like isoform X2 n=1 Tax=Ptychodera flava TaxID=63121 RepID=UPI00396A250B
MMSGQNVFPTVFDVVPMALADDDQFLRGLAWQARDANFTRYEHSFQDLSGKGDTRADRRHPIYLVYEKPGGNVLSRESLQAIKELEDDLISKPGYEDYCQLDITGNCVKPRSIIRFFDGSFVPISPVFNDPNFDNIARVLDTANNIPLLMGILHAHLGRDANIDSVTDVASSTITRSVIPFGLPLEGISDDDEMNANLTNYITSTYYSHLKRFFEDGYKGFSIYYFSEPIAVKAINDQVLKDLILVTGSFVFIFIFVWIQTQSLWIAGFSVIAITASFFGANLFYRYVLDFRLFGILHVLAIFIVLGIGADDVFVFMDTWRATAFEDYPGLEYRLSDTYRRASMTMLVTSLTTAAAFFVTGASPLLGTKTFGIFSGTLVIINYLDVIMFLPSVVVIHHNFWHDCTWCCCRPCRQHLSESSDALDRPVIKKNAIVRFFMGPYFKFVTHKICKWCIIAVFVAVLTVFTYFAATLETHKGPNQDLSRCHPTDHRCTGDTAWDNSFDLNPPPSQKALLEFCQRLRNISDEENRDLYIQRDVVTGELDVKCFIDNMNSFYENLGISMPLNEIKMRGLMGANPGVFDIAGPHDTFYRYFETGIGFWLTMGYTGMPNSDSGGFGDLIGEEIDNRDTSPIVTDTDVYGTRLKYAAIKVKTSLYDKHVSLKRGLEIIDAWEDFMQVEMAKMPPSVANAFQCTCDEYNLWHSFKIRKNLADSAKRSVAIGIAIALPLLVIATQNIITGVMATISIGLTTVCVIGSIPIAGWKYGVLESGNLSMTVGLVVDYVVHLAKAYHCSTKEDRLGRLQDTLESVGVSVISGAATTIGASVFMLFAKIVFFMQFGVFIFCAISFSMLFSLGLFTTMLGIMGPQGRTGSLVVIYHRLIGRKEMDVNCDQCEGKGFHGRGKAWVPPITGNPLNHPK